MKGSAKDLLRRLGRGESIAQVCAEVDLSRSEFDVFWRLHCQARLAPTTGSTKVEGLHGSVSIVRDQRGIPHIKAEDDRDLFFGFGYALAQDRLFQLDYLRRKAKGTLAEIFGKEALDKDLLSRTIGLSRIAAQESAALSGETLELTAAYCRGINAWMEQARGNLPIEFDLLDYHPTPWEMSDTFAIIGEFRWYLTGRFPVIAIPELVKRAVGGGALYQDFITGEAEEESILLPGEYPTTIHWTGEHSGGPGGSSADESGGSNNWTLAGQRTATGKPLVASDPHIPYYAVSIWHEVHLTGKSINVAGVALAGMPAVMIGRNERVAWGITNNICSQRDLYQEKTDDAHPGCFLYNGQWKPWTERTESILVREADGTGCDVVRKTIRSSRNGPIVDEVLPAAIQSMGPVSVRWLGFEPCGWLQAQLDMNRARNCQSFREATRPWISPTFNLVFADVDGGIGFQTVGRIPLRMKSERGYRPGWDPTHQWHGTIPFDHMPSMLDPDRGFVATANNCLAPGDFPYPLAGCWSAGYRHGRIREAILGKPKWDRNACRQMQMDTRSGRAVLCVPALVKELKADADPRVRQAIAMLSDWNCCIDVGSAAATMFDVFFQHWCKIVMAERMTPDQASFASALAGGVASRLLHGDANGWFKKTPRVTAIRTAVVAMLDELTQRLGSEMKTWTWGRVHTLVQKHYLSGRGDLGELLDLSGLPVPGDAVTVCSGSFDASYRSTLGAGYRMVADLADPRAGIWSVEVAGVSGQPGSPHYADQIETWGAGQQYYLPLKGEVEGAETLLLPK